MFSINFHYKNIKRSAAEPKQICKGCRLRSCEFRGCFPDMVRCDILYSSGAPAISQLMKNETSNSASRAFIS